MFQLTFSVATIAIFMGGAAERGEGPDSAGVLVLTEADVLLVYSPSYFTYPPRLLLASACLFSHCALDLDQRRMARNTRSLRLRRWFSRTRRFRGSQHGNVHVPFKAIVQIKKVVQSSFESARRAQTPQFDAAVPCWNPDLERMAG